ncbi:MAG: hypothetical protein A3K90_04485 [Pelodictyon luteolum]|uniref:Uncharacterized protein n=1 Tax=Pelodictyon luteolum TaxID=1100 RepID=A0A165MCD4_PELLU|nr:hypothetical protein [Pelodictyon luteolum]KZK75076.1 MAG: hypothetical protein A3K90_04485 [Pelodictyon luteolum]
MNQNPIAAAATAAGAAGGAALLAPVAAPALHGIAGIAVIGLGLFAAGTAVVKTAGFINEKATGLFGHSAEGKPGRSTGEGSRKR